MRLAISPTTPGLDAADLVDLAVAAEGLGYTSAWLAEVSGAEAFALGAAIAVSTESMDLGVAVVPAATRSPSLMAMGAATISGLLGGRSFGLGIGASSETIVRRWHDREFAPPLRRVREAVEATRTILSGEHSYAGETVTVDRFRLGVAPRGPIDIYLGALGPRMLRLAGAIGDGVCLNLMTVEAVAQQRAELERGAGESGRSLDDGFVVMARFHTVVTDDMDQGRAMIRAGFGPYFAQPVYNRFLEWMGFADEAQAIAAAFAEGDREGVAAALHDDLVDRVALVGPPDVIRGRLDAYAEAGVDVAAIGLIGVDAAGAVDALAGIAAA